MTRRWRYVNGVAVEVTADSPPLTPYVMRDLPAYRSPIDGRTVAGRAQRREDLKRSHSRPWEGKEQELKEAARQRAYDEALEDRRLEQAVQDSIREMSPEKRRLLGL